MMSPVTARPHRRTAIAASAVGLATALVLVACAPSTPEGIPTGGPQRGTDLEAGRAPEAESTPEPEADAESGPEPEPEPEPEAESEAETLPEPDLETVEFTVVSSGDVLPHPWVVLSAQRESAEAGGSGWDFYPLMAGVEHWIAGADLALCSLEVPIRPEGEEITYYPTFGAPAPLVPGPGELGFDGCATANNHSMDRGVAGLVRTLEVFDESGMGHVGTARTAAEAEQPQLYVLERGGHEITIAHIAGTTIDNGLPAPAETPWMVSDADPERLTEQARQARQDGADLVIASLHWGIEYVHEPVTEQLEIAEALADSGQIDMIYGNHSHVPQPIETLAGGPHGEGMPVVWSMGNFISNQDELCCIMETATGTMVVATIEVDTEGVARVSDLEWAANTVDRVGAQRIWPLAELIETDPAERPLAFAVSEEDLALRYARVSEVMGTDRERDHAPQPSGEPATVVQREQE